MAENKPTQTGQERPKALVGCFMGSWAQLETMLDVAIRRILKIEVVAMSILGVTLG